MTRDGSERPSRKHSGDEAATCTCESVNEATGDSSEAMESAGGGEREGSTWESSVREPLSCGVPKTSVDGLEFRHVEDSEKLCLFAQRSPSLRLTSEIQPAGASMRPRTRFSSSQ
mmetsp:Transcript_94429/g.192212  ORF Transcript_94429/g.192212 Transcript_94429/m.192212 type:complete len:115 (-) Transcript_94429:132-476(-)